MQNETITIGIINVNFSAVSSDGNFLARRITDVAEMLDRHFEALHLQTNAHATTPRIAKFRLMRLFRAKKT
jgi:hypothetical protein